MVLRTSRKCQNRYPERFQLLCSRKGQVETQFNWIFVLVVGAIIMIFFVAIVMRQKASSEFKISETVMTDLQSIFIGGSVSTGTSQLIETPKIEIDFDCATYGLRGVNKPIENTVIFAPTKIKGRNIITWTLDYNLPYKVTNFLYLTTPEMRYIFITNNSRTISFYNSTLPEEMNIEFTDDIAQIKNKNNYKVRLIFFSDPGSADVPSELRHLGNDLTALSIQNDRLTFYEARGDIFVKQGENNGVTFTVDFANADQQLEPSKYAAIFTDDIELYNCMMAKALKRAYFVSKIYEKRNRNISDYFVSTNSYCSYFQYSQQDFAIFVTGLEGAHSQFPEDPSIQALPASASQIADKNKILLQKSCPLIY